MITCWRGEVPACGTEARPFTHIGRSGRRRARGLFQEGRNWLEHALAHEAARGELRAQLLHLLGVVLYETGELDQAESTLSEGLRVAEHAGVPAARARIRCVLAEIPVLHGGSIRDALPVCEAAAALLEAEGDLDGAAQAWAVGRLDTLLPGRLAGGGTMPRAHDRVCAALREPAAGAAV